MALTLVGFALFVQAAAYASAQPAYPSAKQSPIESHCEEMADHPMAPAREPQGKGHCPAMQLDCVVAMGCLAPLLAADSLRQSSSASGPRHLYVAAHPAALSSSSGGPEPPPPQVFA